MFRFCKDISDPLRSPIFILLNVTDDLQARCCDNGLIHSEIGDLGDLCSDVRTVNTSDFIARNKPKISQVVEMTSANKRKVFHKPYCSKNTYLISINIYN